MENTFNCTNCGKSIIKDFKSSPIIMREGEQARIFTCPDCGQMFAEKLKPVIEL